jgi:nitroreductase
MDKLALVDHPIHPYLQNRWSPRAFSPRPIAEEDLFSLFEAARWSPSGGNLQPWAYVITMQGSAVHRQFVGLLSGNNQRWAKDAPLLVLTAALRERAAGQANPWAVYDLGQSVAQLTFQATALGLAARQMGGFDKDCAREVFGVPPDYDPVTAIAIGYPGDPDDLPEDLRARESSPRTRKALETFLFANHWDEPLKPGDGASEGGAPVDSARQ